MAIKVFIKRKFPKDKKSTTISTWFSLEDWQTWFESEDRKEIQSSIDAIPGVTTEYSVYRYIKTV
jgi:heme-degrading monooxygenase HmoA